MRQTCEALSSVVLGCVEIKTEIQSAMLQNDVSIQQEQQCSYTQQNTQSSKTTFGLVGLVSLGMIGMIAAEREGLTGSSALKTITPSHSKARYSAGCYGDSSLCAALLTARNGKEFK